MTTPNIAFAIFNGLWPIHADADHGPKALRYSLDFSATIAAIEVNLTEDEMMTQLKFVQTLYIDNSQNANDLTLVVQMTQQRIIAKTKTQGYYSVLAPNTAKFAFSTTAAVVSVPVHFINVPLPAAVWTVT